MRSFVKVIGRPILPLVVLALGWADRPLLAASIVSEVLYLHVDGLGSVRAVTDANGQLVPGETRDYLPFGEEWCVNVNAPCSGVTPGQPKRFTGKERDAETGLDYFGARYYGAKLARFTTVDPVYTWRENLVDPQRWNRYAYVRNNPLRYVDPDGRELTITLYYQYVSKNVAQQVANRMKGSFKSAGVKNVSIELKAGAPSWTESRIFDWGPTPHSHLAELRTRQHVYLTAIPSGEAGHNAGGVSATDVWLIEKRAKGDEKKFIVGLANTTTHEVAHDVMLGLFYHSEGHDLMTEGGARDDKWLFDESLQFTPAQAERLQKQYNRKDEVEKE